MDKCILRPAVYDNRPVMTIGEVGSGPGQLQRPQGVCVDRIHGNIHVADWGNRRVSVFTQKGRYVTCYGTSGLPYDVCCTLDDHVAVTTDDDKVTLYDVMGHVTATWGRFDAPWGICTDGDRLLYVCDKWKHRLQLLDTSGSLVQIIGETVSPGSDVGEKHTLRNPCSVAVHPRSRDIYVVSDWCQVNIYSQTGQYKTCIDKTDIPGVRGFKPHDVSFSSDGLLAISDTYNCCVHLVPDGEVINRDVIQCVSDEGQLTWPSGTTFTDSGDLIVCDHDNNNIQVFTRK